MDKNITQEQADFIEKKKTGVHIVGRARAGCGKSFIVKESARSEPRKKHKFVVFNTKNKDETNNDPSKPRNLEGTTFHSMCLRELRTLVKNPTVKDSKVSSIIRKDDLFNPWYKGSLTPQEKMQRKENHDCMTQLVSLLKNTHIAPTSWDAINIMNKYALYPSSYPRAEFADAALEFLAKSDKDTNNIDYDDMIRMYALNNLGAEFMGDVFMVDEAQDNPMIRTIIMGQIAEVAQVIAVGDDRQAIYAFAGADNDSLNNIISTLDCVVMPLSINFRCDKNIIRQAQKLVPDIQYHESKSDGLVKAINMRDFGEWLRPGDVAIGRFNKTIISPCFKYIKDNKPATIQGKDFGEMLKGMVKSFEASSVEDFMHRLETWMDKHRAAAEKNNNDVAEAIEDRYDCLKFLALACNTVDEIYNRIDKIFTNTNDANTFKFSTGHKSKGLEWDRVIVLEHDDFKSKNPRMPEHQKIQEENIQYIAETRARHELILACKFHDESNDNKVISVSKKEYIDKSTARHSEMMGTAFDADESIDPLDGFFDEE